MSVDHHQAVDAMTTLPTINYVNFLLEVNEDMHAHEQHALLDMARILSKLVAVSNYCLLSFSG